MYYELYIDVFFLVNFMMDYIILLLTRMVLKCPVTHGRICLGALTGALLTCLAVVLPIENTFIKFILFHVVVSSVMIQTGLKTGWNRSFLRAYIFLYVSAFLVGGVMEALQVYVRAGSLFFALALAVYYLSRGVWNLLLYMAGRNEKRCKVHLYMNGQECVVDALVDTGNCLRDTVTGRPVSVIAKEAAKRLGAGESIVRYIPYHSVGKEAGVMPVFVPDKICICRKQKLWIAHPLIAVCEESITADDYEMLVNPDLL